MTQQSERKRAYHQAYYQKNKEAIKAKNRQWTIDNPEKRRKIANAYTARNMDALVERQKEIRKTMYGKSINVFGGIKCRLKHNSNYANVQLKICRKDVFNLLESFSGVCGLCGEETARPSIDRIDSDGHYELSNLRVICLYCNQRGARVKQDGSTGRFISAR